MGGTLRETLNADVCTVAVCQVQGQRRSYGRITHTVFHHN